jgi:hypothetical protein
MMNNDVEELRQVVARWVINESSEAERARLRMFGAELRAMKTRIQRRPTWPSEEELEIALTAMLAIAGRSQVSRAP